MSDSVTYHHPDLMDLTEENEEWPQWLDLNKHPPFRVWTIPPTHPPPIRESIHPEETDADIRKAFMNDYLIYHTLRMHQ